MAQWRLLWSDSARRPTQPIILCKVTHTALAPKHIPGKERSPYISIPTGSWEQGSHHHTSDSAGQHQQSWPPRVLENLASLLPEGDRHILPVKDHAFSGDQGLCPTSSYVSLHSTFILRLLSSLCHCAALEQGPYLTMVSPPSCDHDFQVLGWTSFSLLSPPDDGSPSSVSQPSNCLMLSLQFPQTAGGTLKHKDPGKKTVTLVNSTHI